MENRFWILTMVVGLGFLAILVWIAYAPDSNWPNVASIVWAIVCLLAAIWGMVRKHISYIVAFIFASLFWIAFFLGMLEIENHELRVWWLKSTTIVHSLLQLIFWGTWTVLGIIEPKEDIRLDIIDDIGGWSEKTPE